MKKENLTKTLLLAAVIILSVFAFWGCEKEPYIEQELEMVTQSFGIQNISDNIDLKSWNYNDWIWNYNDVAATLTLTNVEDETKVYTKNVTVQDFINGNVIIQMLSGTYNITFSTVHQRSTNPWFINNESVDIYMNPSLSENIDIDINLTNVLIEGSPINLNATIKDLLIVVDIPDVTEVKISNKLQWINAYNRLLNTVNGTNYGYHWGYFSMNQYEKNTDGLSSTDGLKIKFTVNNIIKEYNISNYELGKVYLFKTNQSTQFNITIPDMPQEIIIVDVE